MYADLRAMGWSGADAFYAVYRDTYSTYPKREINKIIKRLDENPAIVSRMNIKEENINNRQELSSKELAYETSKEKILSDLIISRSKVKKNSKEWIDITKMIADYSKIKQDDIKTEQPIMYHLPVHYPKNCKDCIIGKNMRGEVKKNE